MTMRRRTGSRRRSTSRRTGRNVWVNMDIEQAIIDNSIIAVPILAPASEFMTFDTTIVQVLVVDLTMTFEVETSGGYIRSRVAILTGHDSLVSADFQAPIASSIGPTWMWTSSRTARFALNSVATMAHITDQAARIKAKRRFKENNSTLYLVSEFRAEGGTSTGTAFLHAFIRTLIHIP